MSAMTPLGEFELLVLLAVLRAGPDAYGTRVLDEVRRGARRASRGALYVTLARLEEKGLLRARAEPGGAARGGRSGTPPRTATSSAS